jgi:hypothetical protein
MIAGHFGFAALVKSREREVPLWALMLGTVWLDIVFIPLFLAKIETLSPVPGSGGGYGENFIHAIYTHSLVGALLLSALYGAAFALVWGRRCGIVLGFVSFSHWLLDLIVHRPDLPLLPGNAGHLTELGFGLWNSRVGSILAELLLVLIGGWLYMDAARAVTEPPQKGRTRAVIVSTLIVVSGVTILVLDVTGILR